VPWWVGAPAADAFDTDAHGSERAFTAFAGGAGAEDDGIGDDAGDGAVAELHGLVDAGCDPVDAGAGSAEVGDGTKQLGTGSVGRGGPNMHDAGAWLAAGEPFEEPDHGFLGSLSFGVRTRGRLDAKRREVAAEDPLARGGSVRGQTLERCALHGGFGSKRQPVDVESVGRGHAAVEGTQVFEDAQGDVTLFKLAAIGVMTTGDERQSEGDVTSVLGAPVGLEQTAQAAAEDGEADAITAREMALGDGRNLVDAEVEGRIAWRACPQLDGCIDDDPHDVALVAVEVANEEPASFGGGAPGDAFEWVTGLVLAKLAQLHAVARHGAGASFIGTHAGAAAASGEEHGPKRARQNLDPERIGEGERHFEQPGGALDLEGEAVDGVTSDAGRANPDADAQASAGGNFAGDGLDADGEVAGVHGAEVDVAGGTGIAVAHLGFDFDLGASGNGHDTMRRGPEHLEAGGPDTLDAGERGRAGQGHGEDDASAPGNESDLAGDDADEDDGCACQGEVDGWTGGVDLHVASDRSHGAPVSDLGQGFFDDLIAGFLVAFHFGNEHEAMG